MSGRNFLKKENNLKTKNKFITSFHGYVCLEDESQKRGGKE